MLTLIFLIAGITAGSAMLAGSGGVDPWKAALDAWEDGVSDTIEDDTKEEAAEKIVQDARALLTDMRLKQNEAMKRLFDVDKAYGATEADYAPALEELNAVWIDSDKQFIDLRYKIKALLTDAEWMTLVEHVKQEMEEVKEEVVEEHEDNREAREEQLEEIEEAVEEVKEDREEAEAAQ